MGLACRAWVQARVQPRCRASSNGFRGIVAWTCGLLLAPDLRSDAAASHRWIIEDCRDELGKSRSSCGRGKRNKRSEKANRIFPSFDAKHGAGAPDRLGEGVPPAVSLVCGRKVSKARSPPRQCAYEGAQPQTGSIAIGAMALRAPTTPRYTAPSISPPASAQRSPFQSLGLGHTSSPQLHHLVFFFCTPARPATLL